MGNNSPVFGAMMRAQQSMMPGTQPQMQPAPMSQGPRFMNPMQKMNYVMNAMTNPQQYVFKAFPDVPENLRNDPNAIFSYLQRTRGITEQDVQQIMDQIPRR